MADIAFEQVLEKYWEDQYDPEAANLPSWQPVGGLMGPLRPGALTRVAGMYRTLRWLKSLDPQGVLDIGAGQGYLANAIHRYLGCPVLATDMSRPACEFATSHYGLGSIHAGAHDLPLANKAVDVVVLHNALEYMLDPAGVVAEAVRIGGRYLLIANYHASRTWFEQSLRLSLREPGEPEQRIANFTYFDFTQLFEARQTVAPLVRRSLRHSPQLVPKAEWLEHCEWLASPSSRRSSLGFLLVVSLDGSRIPPLPETHDRGMLAELIRGPEPADNQDPPWDWLSGFVPPPDSGRVLEYHMGEKQRGSVPQGISRHYSNEMYARQEMPAELLLGYRRTFSLMALRWLEWFGKLTTSDPGWVKKRWLLNLPIQGWIEN